MRLWRETGDPLREGADETSLSSVMWRLCRGAESVAARHRPGTCSSRSGPRAELGRLYAHGADAEDPAGIARYIERAVDDRRAVSTAGPADHRVERSRLSRGVRDRRLRDTACARHSSSRSPTIGSNRPGMSYANLCDTSARVPVHRDRTVLPRGTRVLRGTRRGDVRQLRARPLCLALLDVVPVGRGTARRRTRSLSTRRVTDQSADLAHHRGAGHRAPRRSLMQTPSSTEAAHVAVGVDEPQYLAWALCALAEAAWLRGDDDTARADFALARERVTRPRGCARPRPLIAVATSPRMRSDNEMPARPLRRAGRRSRRGAPRAAWDELGMRLSRRACARRSPPTRHDLRESVAGLIDAQPTGRARRVAHACASGACARCPVGARSRRPAPTRSG